MQNVKLSNQLKEKIQTSTNRSERVEILTVLPKSWSIRKIECEFAVATNYVVESQTTCQREMNYVHAKSETS